MTYTPLQESYGFRDPYRVLVISMMLNLTNRNQVRKVLDAGFFARWPTPSDLGRADPGDVAGFITSLGLSNQRANRMVQLGRAMTGTGYPLTASDVPTLPGCGVYAQEAYRIFVDDDISFDPSDVVLSEYLKRIKG